MPVGGKTEPIVAAITVSEKVKTSFNVVVVQECAPVTYDEMAIRVSHLMQMGCDSTV